MKRLMVILSLVMGSFLAVTGQSDTVYFDANWTICERVEAAFYRPKPVAVEGGFMVKDYYISGVMQMQGVSISETEEFWEGVTTWYYPSGEVSQRRSYKGGSPEGISINYDMSGKEMSSAEYKDGEPYSGSVWASEMGSDFITYYEEGRKVKTLIYSSEASSKAKCDVVFESDSIYQISFYDQNGAEAGVIKVVGADRALMNGVFVSYAYHPMVVEKSMTIENGELKSPVKYFYTDGKLKREEFYLGDSELIKEVAYDGKGAILDSVTYKDSYPHTGTKYEFFYAINSSKEADKLERVTKYVNGEISGTTTEYFANGAKRAEKVYLLGEIAELTNYDSLGVVLSKASYKDGMPWEGTINETYNNSQITYKEGVAVLEKRYHANGTLIFKKDLTVEESYDSTGVCIAHLDYVDGIPYNGKSIYSYYDEVSSVTEYKNGVTTLSVSYTGGVESERTTYTDAGEIKERTEFFTNGKPKSVTSYVDGYERAMNYFSMEGLSIGKCTIDENGNYDGVKYSYNGDVVNGYEEYKNGKISRLKSYNSESVLISDVDYNGEAVFYDVTNDKSYKCTYKNGEPFEGTSVKFDSYYNGITSLSNYKNGLIEGESYEYEYDYNSSTYVPSTITTYRGGKLNGLFKQFRNGVLASTWNYVNDVASGATSFYDAEGELLSTAIYKDGLPYDGVVYEFDYLHQVSSIIPYKNGVIDGEAKYYEDNMLNYTLLYLNNDIVKQVSHLDGVAKYSLVYRDGMKYEGDEFSSNTLTHYANGVETLSTEYADEAMTSIVKKRVTVGEVVTESVYYSNNQLKSSIDYKGYSKDGRARFYSADGKEIANGTFVDGYPSVGSFVYFSYDNDLAYLRVEISSKQVVVNEFIDNSKKRTVRYDLLASDSELQSTEISNIISGLSSMFPDYKVDSGY